MSVEARSKISRLFFPFNLRNSKGSRNIEAIHNVAKRPQMRESKQQHLLKQLKNFNHLNKASGRHSSAASRYLEVANIHTKIGLQKKKHLSSSWTSWLRGYIWATKNWTWLFLGSKSCRHYERSKGDSHQADTNL